MKNKRLFSNQLSGAQGRNRTTDTAIFSRMLYQLSYLGAAGIWRGPAQRGYIEERCFDCPAAGGANQGAELKSTNC